MANALKLTREQLALITGGDPRAIKAFEDFLAAVNNLANHAATHQPGGSDPLTVDAVPATGSLRTLGAGAAQACAGNDARLSDARNPTAHAGTHVTGGGDTVANAVAGGNSGLMSGADKTKLDGLAGPYDPLSQTAAGVGQDISLNPAAGAALVAPAGGTWRVYYFGYVAATGAVAWGATTAIVAGGTTIQAGVAGQYWTAWAKRIT